MNELQPPPRTEGALVGWTRWMTIGEQIKEPCNMSQSFHVRCTLLSGAAGLEDELALINMQYNIITTRTNTAREYIFLFTVCIYIWACIYKHEIHYNTRGM